ncbi:MAG TPA: VCBS repeat-containing protein [Solirubrobacter sp.]|nr:VCBS repeat-containing protein [Solirubrobacter sp.]
MIVERCEVHALGLDGWSERMLRTRAGVALIGACLGLLALAPGAQAELFGPPTAVQAGDGPESLAMSDFDRDGFQDLAIATRWYGGEVSVLRGRPGGRFTSPTRIADVDWPTSVVVGDFNEDDRPDIAVGYTGIVNNRNSVSVFLGDGQGGVRSAGHVRHRTGAVLDRGE